MTSPRPDIPNTRINSIDKIETALKILTSQGYNTSSLWEEHNAWLESLERKTIRDIDRQWATQLPEPSSTVDHFINGVPEVLTAARCHVGRQYSLSPGQRDILRERYGLTPTMTVVAANVELFDTEDIIWSIALKSTEHVDLKRRHILNEVVLCPAADFFMAAHLKDAAREKEASERETKTRLPKAHSIAAGYVSVP